MIQSVVNIQTASAKALLVDAEQPAEAQQEGTCSARTASTSRRTRRTCACCWRACGEDLGVEADPVAAFRAGGYAEPPRAAERGKAAVESAYES